VQIVPISEPADRRDRSVLQQMIRTACLLEATARKPGNVHPACGFDDLCYRDFVQSAEAVAPVLAQTARQGVGRSVFEAVNRTQQAVGRNTNLGIILLLAPLAAVGADIPLSEGISDVLNRLTQADASYVYRAIRLARPGGLGTVCAEDVDSEPQGSLLETMRLAADRDAVAAQYANRFHTVLDVGVSILQNGRDFAADPEQGVIGLHLELMSRTPDTLIARKCGPDTATRSSLLAREVLAAGWPLTAAGREKIVRLDDWLRADGHRRNPGTTADLVTACLFAALRDHIIAPSSLPVGDSDLRQLIGS